ncbi:nucleotide disphospho-sugar-binding domain-containing protein [Streptomyces sp. cmx-18-6]|uniref:nucleotide disphospho-sugar-binding domain-containing protein n=1 Tax=Streptomyces sp. cmx-18-6 TaxID=2790930 RepID=UPI003980F488
MGWTPLSTPLTACDAIIHHSGSGATLASARTGVPQAAVPHGADNWINAAMIERRGQGLRRDAEQIDAQLLDTLPHDHDMRSGPREARAVLAAEPGPDLIDPRLQALTE